jgi:hypothetical protein
MTKNKEIVNIYLRDEDVKEEVLTGASPHEKYIILMNDTLQAENREYVILIKELEDRVEEMEEELGSVETRNSNIKCLLKNFHEMDKWRRELSEQEKEMLSCTQSSIHSFKYRATRHLRVLEGILALFIGLCFEYFPRFEFFPVFGIFIVIVAFQESTLQNLQLPSFPKEEKKAKQIREEITKTVKAQDYIHEFLDSQ